MVKNKNTCLHCLEIDCNIRKECPDREEKP